MNTVSPARTVRVAQTLRLGEQLPSPWGEASDDTRNAAVLPSLCTPRKTSTGSEPDDSGVSGTRMELWRELQVLPKATRTFAAVAWCLGPPPEDRPPPEDGVPVPP